MKIRFYNQQGEEIEKEKSDPYCKWHRNSKTNRPQDYVMIKQLEIKEVLLDPYGREQEIVKLSEPVEEVYCGWVWENESWYCLVRMVVKKNQVIIDRRPAGWKFYDKFNQNRPRFV